MYQSKCNAKYKNSWNIGKPSWNKVNTHCFIIQFLNLEVIWIWTWNENDIDKTKMKPKWKYAWIEL